MTQETRYVRNTHQYGVQNHKLLGNEETLKKKKTGIAISFLTFPSRAVPTRIAPQPVLYSYRMSWILQIIALGK